MPMVLVDVGMQAMAAVAVGVGQWETHESPKEVIKY